MTQQYREHKILIDPQRLMLLRRQRKSLKMVPSSFEPPPDEQKTLKDIGIQSMGLDVNRLQVNTSAPTKLSSDVPNVQFIASLVPARQMGSLYTFQEGDYIPWEMDDRWLLVQGQILVTGKNGYSFQMSKGYIFFLTKQTKRKVKQVFAVTTSKLARIPAGAIDQYVRNYMFIKNAQKIKYLKYCPFLIWNDQLCEDLALSMEMVQIEKDQIIYRQNEEAEEIYFVKEGIVLLQRNMAVKNQVVRDYEMHYQRDQANQNDVLLVARKGMVFGIDGVLLKQKTQGSSFKRYKSRKTSYDFSSKIRDQAKSLKSHQKSDQQKKQQQSPCYDDIREKNNKVHFDGQIQQQLTEQNKFTDQLVKQDHQIERDNQNPQQHRSITKKRYDQSEKDQTQLLPYGIEIEQKVPIKVIKAKQSQMDLESPIQNSQREQQKEADPHKSDSRIYTAKTMGKCQIYKLKKSVLSTFFNIKDMLKVSTRKKQLSSKQIDRICQQYTQLLLNGKTHQASKITKSLKNIEFAFGNIKPSSLPRDKKQKIENIKLFEKQVRKKSVEHIVKPRTDSKANNMAQKVQYPFRSYSQSRFPNNAFHPTFIRKFSIKQNRRQEKQDINLPILNKKDLQKAMLQVRKQSEISISKAKQGQQYRFFKRSGQISHLQKQGNYQTKVSSPIFQKKVDKPTDGSFMQVKAYRSIINQIC